eukprot:TRINITY_DN8411_c0_g1_i1.p1 TRINITY_DN8411_c0_g1~~TRINITY_DN8411_c0_g1_i1.p1  ORF type:complete len:889 (-),score=90.23 TRINITY_DN8411_c0_g1_i1:30-2696(-)
MSFVSTHGSLPLLIFFSWHFTVSLAQTANNVISSISPTSISAGFTTSVTFTGSSNGDTFSWSAVGAADCSSTTPSTGLTASNEVVSVALGSIGTYKLCYRASGQSDSIEQTGRDLTVVAGTSPSAITISPSAISVNTATSITFTGSASGEKFSWSAAGAASCTGVTPSTGITSTNEVVAGVSFATAGTYRLCYQGIGGSDSVSQTNGILTVSSATSASVISSISPTSISAGYTTSVTLTGSSSGDLYSWSGAGAPDCSSTTPSTALTASNEVVSVLHAGVGTYKLCYRASGNTDSVEQTGRDLTVVAATSATAINLNPESITINTATSITFTGSGNGDKFSWSAVGAADCTGVTPSTALTSTDEVVSVSQSSTGTYRLCFREAGGSDSVSQNSGTLTVVAVTSGTAITISPNVVVSSTATEVTFTGSVYGDTFSWSAQGASDCTGVVPSTLITQADEVMSVTLATGSYKLCWRAVGGSDSVIQTNGAVTASPALSSLVVTSNPDCSTCCSAGANFLSFQLKVNLQTALSTAGDTLTFLALNSGAPVNIFAGTNADLTSSVTTLTDSAGAVTHSGAGKHVTVSTSAANTLVITVESGGDLAAGAVTIALAPAAMAAITTAEQGVYFNIAATGHTGITNKLAYTPYSTVACSDPITFFNGKRTKFWISFGCFTALLRTPDVSILARPLVGPTEDMQWFGTVRLELPDGTPVAEVSVVQSPQKENVTRSGLRQFFHGRELNLALYDGARHVTRSRVPLVNQVPGTVSTLFSSADRRLNGAFYRTRFKHNERKEVVVIETPSVTFHIVGNIAGAEYSDDFDLQQQHRHLDLAFDEAPQGYSKCTGLLPELWEVIPRSAEAELMTVAPSNRSIWALPASAATASEVFACGSGT